MWKCDVCGYVHTGTEPIDTCPICGVGWDKFTPLELKSSPKATTGDQWRCTICNYVHDGPLPDKCPVCNAGKELFASESPALSAATTNLVIIGGGIAGFTAAEQALEHGQQDVNITIISEEPHLPYYRLNLTRYLASEVDESSLTMKEQTWFDTNKITMIYGEVNAIQTKEKQLTMADGQQFSYDTLILANGAHPFIPPISGVTKGGVFPLRTLEQTKNVRQQAHPHTNCVIIGCGLLGLEAAGALAQQVNSVTVLENASWAMKRQLNPKAAQKLTDHLNKMGITILTNVTAKTINGDSTVRSVTLSDGQTLPADLVIVSTGVRPNLYLAKESGLNTGRGVIVNDQMQTSDPSIYAAGDVTEHRGMVYGIWPTAFSQGWVAGVNAGGGKAEFQGNIPFNQLKVIDVELYSTGQIEPLDGSYTMFESESSTTYHMLMVRDRKLVGAILFGNTELASYINDAIQNKTNINELTQLETALEGWSGFLNQ